MTPTQARRAAALLILSSAAWAGCFAVLAEVGSWRVFALVGLGLGWVVVRFGPPAPRLLALSPATLVQGIAGAAALIAATYAGYALLDSWSPALAASTASLYGTMRAGMPPNWLDTTALLTIAACEELVFRGACLPSATGRPGRFGLWVPTLRQSAWVLAGAALYASATVPVGSLLLFALAFACGCVWGLTRVCCHSLVPALIMHLGWDVVVLILWPLR